MIKQILEWVKLVICYRILPIKAWQDAKDLLESYPGQAIPHDDYINDLDVDARWTPKHLVIAGGLIGLIALSVFSFAKFRSSAMVKVEIQYPPASAELLRKSYVQGVVFGKTVEELSDLSIFVTSNDPNRSGRAYHTATPKLIEPVSQGVLFRGFIRQRDYEHSADRDFKILVIKHKEPRDGWIELTPDTESLIWARLPVRLNADAGGDDIEPPDPSVLKEPEWHPGHAPTITIADPAYGSIIKSEFELSGVAKDAAGRRVCALTSHVKDSRLWIQEPVDVGEDGSFSMTVHCGESGTSSHQGYYEVVVLLVDGRFAPEGRLKTLPAGVTRSRSMLYYRLDD